MKNSRGTLKNSFKFHANPKGQQAVRLVKVHSEDQGWKGDKIERLVLQAQQEFPTSTSQELAYIAAQRYEMK